MKEMFLVTKLNGADRSIFANEEDILPSIRLTYSTLDVRVEVIGRNMVIVKLLKEDAVNADVFTINRIPVYYDVEHL